MRRLTARLGLPAWATPYAAMAREDELAWPTLDDVTRAAKAFLDPVLAGEMDACWSPQGWKYGRLVFGMTAVILGLMKTAVSIPERVFNEADRLARRLGISRSELYARAVERFVGEHSDRAVTERLNKVYGEHDGRLERTVERAQFEALGPREEW